ncbi:hypothetical protein H0H92_001540 [Tricholoma furcatifolium]|nr:hypothetical protein H0H92_001540 [Tricholoma furcatifolium]
MIPPTSRLPPIRQIASYSTKDLLEGLTYLRHIYKPEVQGTRRRKPEPSLNPVAIPRPAEVDEDLDAIRSDTFERSYALRWLTALVSISGTDYEANSSLDVEALVQEAASLLAVCSGTAGAGVIFRDFAFRVGPEMQKTVNVLVKDLSLDNKDYGSVGAQTWGGACVLSEMILDDPAAFGLLKGRKLSILELGAGTGLVGLAIGKFFECASSLVPPTIVTTDYYPSVLDNLAFNIRTNFPDSDVVTSHFLDWSSFPDEISLSPPLNAPFDLVVGADIIYEAQHATWIKSCLTRLLQKPSADWDPLFHLMIPLRFTHASESSTIETIFASPTPSISEPHLTIVSKEIIECDTVTGSGNAQVEYAYYKIGWR